VSQEPGCKIPIGLVPALREAGVAVEHVLASARLPSRLLDTPGRYVPPLDYFALWNGIRVVSGDPSIGIRLATLVKPALTEPLFLAVLSCGNLAEAIGVVSRFKRLLEPEDLIVLEDAKHEQVSVTYRWSGGDEQVPQVLVDAELAFLVEIGRRGTGRLSLCPREIVLRASSLEADRTHEAFFRCPIRLDAARNGVVFSVHDTREPFASRNPELLNALLPHLQANTPVPPDAGLARVRSVIAERVRGRRPEADEIARELAMSTRAMQRMLKGSGTSYRQLLDEVRNEHARGYLCSTSFSDGEVSFLLGFEDPNSFYRAFRSWNGMSPAEFRRRGGLEIHRIAPSR
jgi:AraC-like DNA-binding protein